MAATASNPISDLAYDWLTVAQSKAEAMNAYTKYIQDAEKAGAQECVALFQKLHEQDAKQVEEIKSHLMKVLSQS